MKDIAGIVTFFTAVFAIAFILGAFVSMNEIMLTIGLVLIVLTAVPVNWK